MLKELFTQRILRGLVRRLNNLHVARVAWQVAKRAPEPQGRPVAFFKASTGIDDLSWNSAFHLLASWGFRLQGVPVVFFACNAGMSRCVLGTDRDDPQKVPPCASCTYQSRTLYAGLPSSSDFNSRSNDFSRYSEKATKVAPAEPIPASYVHWFTFDRDPALERALEGLNLEKLSRFERQIAAQDVIARSAATKQSPVNNMEAASPFGRATTMPLGELCLPGLRWILRKHNLDDDENARFLLREYILSAWNIAQKFARFLVETNPRAVIVFNGQFFPEATARWVARKRGIRVITHEVGLQPASAFFTDGEATAYPIHIPADFEMSAEQNARLDAYLEKRFQGQFTMAGIKFWPSMKGLDEAFLARAAGFKQIVPVFTNIIFDTSQPHANTVFADMFAWLDQTLEAIKSHPEALFVIRAHPDELRVRKQSRETVAAWVDVSGANKLSNVVLVAPNETLSSYELIQRSKFVMVYNSTIGLEASILGAPVLCAGKARFTQYPTVFFPQSVAEYRRKTEEFLKAKTIKVPPEFKRNARRFLYYQLFRTSLPFGDYLMPSVRATQARLKLFELNELVRSPAMKAILKGVLEDGNFLLEK